MKQVEAKILTDFLTYASPAQKQDFEKKKNIKQKYKYLLDFCWINQDQYIKYTKGKI